MNSKPNPYQVIARKYRPQTFANVVGQEAVVTTLKNALRFKRLAHAYLFCGCRGTGKTTLARLFAKALNCKQLTAEYEPCNNCSSCFDIVSSRALDVIEIDGASNRGIDDIRQINETIGYAPSSGKYKIYIIDEVHMLTKEAFNALLKTLEEPPENVKFFFATTEPHKVLPTILSRCQRFDLNRIPFEQLTQKLKDIAEDLNIPCEEEIFSLIAHLAEGSLRDAESLLDQILCYAEPPVTALKVSETLGLLPQSALFALDQAFLDQNLSFAFELTDQIFSSGKELSYFLETLLNHYRQLLKYKLGTSQHFSTNKQKELIAHASSIYTQEQCLYILDYLIQWQQQINKLPFKRVTLEMILLHIIRSKYRVTLPSLVKKLNDLSVNFKEAESQQTISETQKISNGDVTLETKPSHKEVASEVSNLEEQRTPSIDVVLEAKASQDKELSIPKEPTIPSVDLNLEIKASQDEIKDIQLELPHIKKLEVPNINLNLNSQGLQDEAKEIQIEISNLEREEVRTDQLSLEINTAQDQLNEVQLEISTTTSDIDLALETKVSENEIKEVQTQSISENEEAISTGEALLKKMREKIESHSLSSQIIESVVLETNTKLESSDLEKSSDINNNAINPTLDSSAHIKKQSHYETLMRFAAVELEGVLKKESF